MHKNLNFLFFFVQRVSCDVRTISGHLNFPYMCQRVLSRQISYENALLESDYISCVLFLINRPTFYKIVRRRAVEQYSPIPYLATFMNCLLWLVYGLPFVTPNSVLVLTINGIGLGMESIYLFLYFAFASKKQRVCYTSSNTFLFE